MKIFTVFAFLFLPLFAIAQPNCNVYKLKNDSLCYKACVTATEGQTSQGSKESQLRFDQAIKLCPSFDHAYFEKSVPYLKRGDFVTWKKLIDQAVALNPAAHLGYRGWCRYQFIRDYRGAINDLEKLATINTYDIGYSINGDYHLNVAKALSYKAIGEKLTAIKIIEDQLSKKDYSPMTYDYFHLGVLKMEIGDTEDAITYLEKSIAYNEYLAEPYYYLALIYDSQGLKDKFKVHMEKAKTLYLKGYKRFDVYTHPMDKIYLADIETQLERFK